MAKTSADRSSGHGIVNKAEVLKYKNEVDHSRALECVLPLGLESKFQPVITHFGSRVAVKAPAAMYMHLFFVVLIAAISRASKTHRKGLLHERQIPVLCDEVPEGPNLCERSCGAGYVACGPYYCYKPSAGETCCAGGIYGTPFSCPSGSYCAVTNDADTCCPNSLSVEECGASRALSIYGPSAIGSSYYGGGHSSIPPATSTPYSSAGGGGSVPAPPSSSPQYSSAAYSSPAYSSAAGGESSKPAPTPSFAAQSSSVPYSEPQISVQTSYSSQSTPTEIFGQPPSSSLNAGVTFAQAMATATVVLQGMVAAAGGLGLMLL